MTAPYLFHVPKDVQENLRWRARCREAALHDTGIQRALYDACMGDVLFFINFAGWVLEPRGRHKVLPFVSWPHQDPVALAMDQAITEAEGSESPLALTLKKSRAQGATYLYINVLVRRWLRDREFSAGLVTRNEKLVDSKTDKDTILYKVVWALKQLPPWMLPKGFDPENKHRSLTDHTVWNPENGSTFTGYAATGDVARGGRKTVFALDEFGSEEFVAGGKDHRVMSSVSSVTNCIFLVSTYGSDTGAFAEAADDPDNPRLCVLDWKDNPTQTRNAYVVTDGRPVAVRPEEQSAVEQYFKANAKQIEKIERRGHEIEGKFRAPFYDAHCLLPGATPRYIAREYDMNPRGAAGKFFDPKILDRARQGCRPPVWQGRPVFDEETLELKGLIRQEGGPLKLWFEPGLDRRPPPGTYVVGCDIAMGTSGTSATNSVAEGVNRNDGRQVMEYASRHLQATRFGSIAVGLAKWLRKAYLGWECTGPGGDLFKDAVADAGYWNIYMRTVDEIGSTTKTKKAGWANFKDKDKAKLLEGLCLAMADGDFTPMSEDLIRECGEYEIADGKIVHKPSQQEGVLETSHGDRCIAAGVADLLRRDRPENGLDSTPEQAETAKYGCLAWRIAQAKAEARDEWGGYDGWGASSVGTMGDY